MDIEQLRVASIVMGNLPEVSGYNGSLLQIDDIEASNIEKSIDLAIAEIERLRQQLAEQSSRNTHDVLCERKTHSVIDDGYLLSVNMADCNAKTLERMNKRDDMKDTEIIIGTQYMSAGKHPRKCTVIDIHKTYNADNFLVKTRYVATHELLGQTITDYEVCAVTIQRGQQQ